MSINRDKNTDRFTTKSLIGEKYISKEICNWLGHKNDSGAANIDRLLLVGTTSDELKKYRSSFLEHLRHLKEEHGLTIIEDNGILKLKA
ncbi:hypothetical protein [Desulfobacter sp.]|uniref:hypothetical protein n=1 Tax=Desulfobacter sp. TaxID=2294 RepID=UPI00257DD6BC|nr:hypothetical protein [Desulfobacter sp.]